MSTELKGFLIAGGIAAVLFYFAHRLSATSQGATGGTTPAKLDATNTDAITESAYHQAPTMYAAPFGPEENRDGEEVISTQ